MKTLLPFVLLALAGLLPLRAQDAPGRHLDLFNPIALPAPNEDRAADGRPGTDYWQQRADYRIRATLDTVANRVTGMVTITYTNNSPNALADLWLQLDQNLFAPGSRGASIQPATSRWRGSFPGGGFQITQVEVDQGGAQYAPQYLVDDTRMRLTLREPLAGAGARVSVTLGYNFLVPEYGADRMGRLHTARGTIYEIAQWYPRMYVYDDVNGWNALPYYGQGEFYLDYGNYDVELTVPRELIVVATGALQNPEQVLTPTQRQRLDRARTSEETVMIVAPDEVGTPGARPEGTMLTWRFKAENVRDVAWAASRSFIWDAAAWDGILIQSVYPHEGLGQNGAEGWEASTQDLRHTIRHYSEQWFRYPYPVATNVAGVVGGMEYPMIVFCSARARNQGLFGVTDHEFGHTWFPMIVGSDERRYAWMDEGFNTFINYYSNLDFYGADARRAGRTSAESIAQGMTSPLAAEPIMTPPDLIPANGLGFLAYSKPGAGLRLLREYILGPDRFDPAFRTYIQRWAFKHPQPADFFRTIENVAGEDLDYFWRGWFYSTDTFDQGITKVETGSDGTTVTLANLDGLVLPTTLQITYADGTTERRTIPALAWATSSTFTELVEGKPVAALTLDPDGLLPDKDRSNDTWGNAPTPGATAPRGGR